MDLNELELLLKSRFNKYIELKDASGCWECVSHYKDAQGYVIVPDENRKLHRLHRVVFALVKDKLDSTSLVRHSCDNPSCCNPNHLNKGTHQDNKNDCVEKDRHARGERNRHAKLTEEQVKEIKYGSMKTKDCVKKFGVTPVVIQCIRRGVSWKHI